MGRHAIGEADAVRALITTLPGDAQQRVNAVAERLREAIAADDGQEAELALTLVLAELIARSQGN